MFMLVLFGGLAILALWAVVNIVMWRKSTYQQNSTRYYFWQMNGLWNIVNLSIAIIAALIAIVRYDAYATNESLQVLQIKIIAVNILLDLLYVVAGLLIENKGKKIDNQRYIGYGDAIQLQGAFLFCFDSIFALALLVVIL